MPSIGLTAEHLAQVFPFHFAFDREGAVIQTGPALRKAFPELSAGHGIDQYFCARRPKLPLRYEAVRQSGDSLFILESKMTALVLKGQMVALNGTILFLGSPWITDIQDVDRVGVSLVDFAIHDPVADYLVLLQTKNTALADTQRLSGAVQETKSRLQNIIASMDDSLLVLTPECYIETVNAATCGLLGYTELEMLGQHVGFLLASEENREEESGHDVRVSGSGLPEVVHQGPVRNLDVIYKTKNGQNIPMLLTASVLRGPQRAVAGIVCVARDLRDRLRAEAEAAHAAAERSRAEDLATAYEELSRAHEDLQHAQAQLVHASKMAAIGRLAGGVAHEVNNPLGVILGFAQGMESRISEDDPLRLAVTSIVREAMRCKSLVQELLTFARTGTTTKERIDLNDLVTASATLLQSRAKTQDIQLIEDLADGLTWVEGNRTQLQQVIINLGNNAMDATPRGGIVTLRACRVGDHVLQLEVNDTGSGVPESIRSRIFDPFFTTKDPGQGTGLGLSLVYEIVQQHFGTIEVDSEEGKGTTVSVRLPMTPLREAQRVKTGEVD